MKSRWLTRGRLGRLGFVGSVASRWSPPLWSRGSGTGGGFTRLDLNADGWDNLPNLDLFDRNYFSKQAKCGLRAWPVSPRPPKGDVTGDGFVSYADYHLAVKWFYVARFPGYPVETWFQWPSSTLSAAEQQANADVGGDGKVDFDDLIALYHFVLGYSSL